MNKSTRWALGGTGLGALALVAALAQANSPQYAEIDTIKLNMSSASLIASEAVPGQIFEAELELDGANAYWEFEIVGEGDRMISVEVDVNSGQVLSIESDDELSMQATESLDLASVIEIVSVVDNGLLLEAELEQEDGQWTWEVETLGADNQIKELQINATSGQIVQ